MQHEAQLQNFISAALRQNATILARRHVAERVLSGDMSMFDKAAEAEFKYYSRMQAPHKAGLQVRQLSTLFKSDVRSALPFVAVRLHPGPTGDPDTEDLLADPALREELEIAAWLGFISAMFTGQALQSILSPICHNMVAWGAAPVVASATNWAGRPVSLQRFIAAMDTDSPEFSYVEFTHLEPSDVWDEYDRLISRVTKAEAEGIELKEKWQVAALERQLINTLEPEWCCQRFPFLTAPSSVAKDGKTHQSPGSPQSSGAPHPSVPFHSGVEQFGFRRLYREHLSSCRHEATSKARPIPVASVYYVGLDRSVTRYIIPHPGPQFRELTPDQLRTRPELANCPVELVPPVMTPLGANAAIGSTIVNSMAPYPNSPIEGRPALKAHVDWPTLLFKETLKADDTKNWAALIRPHTTQIDQDVQDSTGVASVLVAAHLDIASTRLDFRARSKMAGSLAHDSNQVGKPQFRKVGPLVFSNVTMHQHQPTVDYQAFRTEIELANSDVAEILDVLDPSVSDKLSGRPTTKEVQERGAAVQSRRIGFARERAPAISDWLRRVFATLLNTEYKGHEIGYNGSIEFWAVLTSLLSRYEPLVTKGKDPKLNKPLIRKLLAPFEVDLTFEDASMDVLQSRLSMAPTDRQKAVLAAKMRILMGEDPGCVAKDMARAGLPKDSDQVAAAAVESFALKGGERIPVSPNHDHWSHFTTHFAAAQEVITTVQQNPNADPINAMTSLIQLGTHMSDHRDLAVESVIYAAYVEQMDQVLQAISGVIQELAPLAKAEAMRAAEQAQPGDTKAAAEQQKMAQRQASWEQRAAQREEAAKVSARMREENHAQALRMKAEAGALAINVTATKAAIKLRAQ